MDASKHCESVFLFIFAFEMDSVILTLTFRKIPSARESSFS